MSTFLQTTRGIVGHYHCQIHEASKRWKTLNQWKFAQTSQESVSLHTSLIIVWALPPFRKLFQHEDAKPKNDYVLSSVRRKYHTDEPVTIRSHSSLIWRTGAVKIDLQMERWWIRIELYCVIININSNLPLDMGIHPFSFINFLLNGCRTLKW